MKFALFSIAFVATVGSLSGLSLIPPPPTDTCPSPAPGQGLSEGLRELIDMFPVEKLLEIYLTWVTGDEGTQRAMEYIESGDFVNIINLMHNQPAFIDTMNYLCQECFFDGYFYLNSLGGIFNFPPMLRPRRVGEPRLTYDGYTGFRGMLRELHAALPMDDLRATYQRRMDTDIYFRQALDKIGSPEFRVVGCAIQATREYDDLIQKLEEIGVDTDDVLNFLFSFFNWPVNC